jgi:hypothetical protein
MNLQRRRRFDQVPILKGAKRPIPNIWYRLDPAGLRLMQL